MHAGGFGKRVAARLAVDVDRASAAGVAVEGDSARRSFLVAVPVRGPLDIGGATGRTHQELVLAIGRDQNQCFRCPILLDTPASHGLPLRREG